MEMGQLIACVDNIHTSLQLDSGVELNTRSCVWILFIFSAPFWDVNMIQRQEPSSKELFLHYVFMLNGCMPKLMAGSAWTGGTSVTAKLKLQFVSKHLLLYSWVQKWLSKIVTEVRQPLAVTISVELLSWLLQCDDMSWSTILSVGLWANFINGG